MVDFPWLLLSTRAARPHPAFPRSAPQCFSLLASSEAPFSMPEEPWGGWLCCESSRGCQLVSSLALKGPASAPRHAAFFLACFGWKPYGWGPAGVCSRSLLCHRAGLYSLICSFCCKIKSNLSPAPGDGGEDTAAEGQIFIAPLLFACLELWLSPAARPQVMSNLQLISTKSSTYLAD